MGGEGEGRGECREWGEREGEGCVMSKRKGEEENSFSPPLPPPLFLLCLQKVIDVSVLIQLLYHLL